MVTDGEIERRGGKLGTRDEEIPSILYKINKLQGYTTWGIYFIITISGL